MVWVVGVQSNPAISGAKETGQLGEPDRLAPVNTQMVQGCERSSHGPTIGAKTFTGTDDVRSRQRGLHATQRKSFNVELATPPVPRPRTRRHRPGRNQTESWRQPFV